MNGLSEFQIASLLLLVISTGIIIGSLIGMLTRALHSVFYK